MQVPKLFIALIGAVLILAPLGCLEVPLGDPEKSMLDPQLVGWWQDAQGSSYNYVIPIDSHAYLVTAYGWKDDGGQKKPAYTSMSKAWTTRVADMDIMTFKLIGAQWDLQNDADVRKRYALYRITHVPGGVQLTRVNEKLLADCKTPDAIAKAIEANAKNPDLWDSSEPARTLTGVPDSGREDLKKLIDQFNPS